MKRLDSMTPELTKMTFIGKSPFLTGDTVSFVNSGGTVTLEDAASIHEFTDSIAKPINKGSDHISRTQVKSYPQVIYLYCIDVSHFLQIFVTFSSHQILMRHEATRLEKVATIAGGFLRLEAQGFLPRNRFQKRVSSHTYPLYSYNQNDLHFYVVTRLCWDVDG